MEGRKEGRRSLRCFPSIKETLRSFVRPLNGGINKMERGSVAVGVSESVGRGRPSSSSPSRAAPRHRRELQLGCEITRLLVRVAAN